MPFDQLDFVAGALVLAWPFAALHAVDVPAIALISLLGDLAVNRLAFRLGLRDTPW
ncbi:CDP-archaeol synthase [Frateuria defendens]|uniref:CDP-archaeol synthase n=1 Tax=Frateuria defendens TaxID=2219559 RepID=UPI001379245D|nr:CDP-archaeol synthase [Frateuria defendens]